MNYMKKKVPLHRFLNMNNLYVIILLTLVWVVLVESFSVFSIIAGIAISTFSVLIFRHFLPLQKYTEFRFFRFIAYLFFLFGNIYVSAIKTIMLIFKETSFDTITLETRLSNPFLQTMLAASITLTPGTISLDVKDNTITVLFLKETSQSLEESRISVEATKDKLEKLLLKAEKERKICT